MAKYIMTVTSLLGNRIRNHSIQVSACAVWVCNACSACTNKPCSCRGNSSNRINILERTTEAQVTSEHLYTSL